jgi:hypothetical protein
MLFTLKIEPKPDDAGFPEDTTQIQGSTKLYCIETIYVAYVYVIIGKLHLTSTIFKVLISMHLQFFHNG